MKIYKHLLKITWRQTKKKMERLNSLVQNLTVNLEYEKKNNYKLSLTVDKLLYKVEQLMKQQNDLIEIFIKKDEERHKQLTRLEIETSILIDVQYVIQEMLSE